MERARPTDTQLIIVKQVLSARVSDDIAQTVCKYDDGGDLDDNDKGSLTQVNKNHQLYIYSFTYLLRYSKAAGI